MHVFVVGFGLLGSGRPLPPGTVKRAALGLSAFLAALEAAAPWAAKIPPEPMGNAWGHEEQGLGPVREARDDARRETTAAARCEAMEKRGAGPRSFPPGKTFPFAVFRHRKKNGTGGKCAEEDSGE